jgi:hypothetical protein
MIIKNSKAQFFDFAPSEHEKNFILSAAISQSPVIQSMV